MAENKSLPADEEPISLEGEEEEPISLVEEEEAKPNQPAAQALSAFGGQGIAKKAAQAKFRRNPANTGQGAVRCRLFHSKVAVGSLEYMESQINEWIDANDIDVKHVGHVIGVMEGKTQEPNLLVMVWY